MSNSSTCITAIFIQYHWLVKLSQISKPITHNSSMQQFFVVHQLFLLEHQFTYWHYSSSQFTNITVTNHQLSQCTNWGVTVLPVTIHWLLSQSMKRSYCSSQHIGCSITITITEHKQYLLLYPRIWKNRVTVACKNQNEWDFVTVTCCHWTE